MDGLDKAKELITNRILEDIQSQWDNRNTPNLTLHPEEQDECDRIHLESVDMEHE